MRRVIIVQARMGSTRLPGKVLADLCGRPMLAQQLRRLQTCRNVDEIVIATTTNDGDDPVVALAKAVGVRWFRGDERDVLDRYIGAAADARADVVARITADCPLIDPMVTDRVVAEAAAGNVDYASNVLRRTYPKGLDAEAMPVDVLVRLGRLARSDAAREHVTWYIRQERPDLFVQSSIEDRHDHSALRWDVDTPEDLARIRQMYEALRLGDRVLGFEAILQHSDPAPR